MRALQLTGYGDNSQLKLTHIETPEPNTGQVNIKVDYAGLNPVDFKTRNGMLKLILPYRLPQTMGNEVAGTIESVGANVSDFSKGDRVFARLRKEHMGGFAEHVVTDATLVAKIPDNLSTDIAAGVPLVALTAWQCLHQYGQIGPGSKVLIHAGAGAVGRVAIQMAKNAGAYVATTVSERGESLVAKLGADKIINYKTQQFDHQISDYDFVLDTVAGETLKRSYKVLKRGGKLCTISATPERRTAYDLAKGRFTTLLFAGLFSFISLGQTLRAMRYGVDYRFLFMRPDGKQLANIAEQIRTGKLVFDIDKQFDLGDYQQAFDALEQQTAFGKVVLRITDS